MVLHETSLKVVFTIEFLHAEKIIDISRHLIKFYRDYTVGLNRSVMCFINVESDIYIYFYHSHTWNEQHSEN